MIVNGHDFKQVNGSKTLLIPLVLMIRHNLFFKEIALQICAPHHVVFSIYIHWLHPRQLEESTCSSYLQKQCHKEAITSISLIGRLVY